MAAGNPSFGLTTQDLKSFGSSLTGGGGNGPTIIDAEAAGANITVPGGTMLLTADFSKAGNDLVIQGQDGSRVVVQDYFTADPTPALRTSGGASLPAEVVERLAGAGDTMQFAQAGLLVRQHFEGDRAVFELNEGHHHDHLVCLQCGRVEEFHDPVIEARQQQLAEQRGFALQDHALSLYGLCDRPGCRDEPGT